MLNGLLSLGNDALMAAQTGISVTGQNIANADTEGYSRRTVSYTASGTISIYGHKIGTGVDVSSIERCYNKLLANQYLSALSGTTYYSTQAELLSTVEALLAESDKYGVSTALDKFLSSISALAEAPDDENVRQEFISYSETLADTLQTLQSGLESLVESINKSISDDVTTANTLMQQIADLNTAIAANPDDPALLDERDIALKELANLLDIQTVEQDNGMVTVLTAAGQTLVDESKAYTLSFEGQQSFADLSSASDFEGSIYFEGSSSDEITVDILTSGPADGSASAATFRVSLDGGETWVTDEDGNELVFTAGGYNDAVEVNGVLIYFGQSDDPTAEATTDLNLDDEFTIVAKSALYWYRTTSDKVNITPQEGGGGNRLEGGEIAGLFTTRDESVQEYLDNLNELAHELIWQINYQHSQGASLEHYSTTSAENAVDDPTLALADSDLAYADKLTEGSLTFAFYDEDSDEALGLYAVDFSSIVPPGTSTFDPAVHTLEDVATAINNSCGGNLTATVSGGILELTAGAGVDFEFAGDTTGLLSALGVNTFFSGDDISSMKVSTRIADDPALINIAQVDGTGAVNMGDSENAHALADIVQSDVVIGDSIAPLTFTEYLHNIIANVGLDADTSARQYTLAATVSSELSEKMSSISGVSMDEEVTNLLKYQQYYQVAARLIQTAGELFDIVMSLKS